MKVFLIDAYSDGKGIIIWGICEDNTRKAFIIPFNPWFYILYDKKCEVVLRDFFLRFKGDISLNFEVMNNIIDGSIEVLKIICRDPVYFFNIVSYIRRSNIPVVTDVYNIDLTPVEMFFFTNGIFPFSWIDIDIKDGEYIVQSYERIEDTEYSVPDLRILSIMPDCGNKDVSKLSVFPDIKIIFEGREEVLEYNDILFADNIIKRCDPDIIICHYGDSLYMKRFYELGFKNLNRDDKDISKGRDRSYFSYGKIIYKSGFVNLCGRLHIDPENSFFYKEAGMEGVIDICRISCMPLQMAARTSPGTVITSIETRKAFEDNILIPFRKTKSEEIKKASDLLVTDKGGFNFRPLPGIFENVCELDFFSMYPSIMVNYNLSYETVFCKHKDCKKRLPGTDYRICDKKKGIIPEAIEFILKRRIIIKQKMLDETDNNKLLLLNRNQIALKWLLVVSFGYLGYKRARFGRIECHESTTSIGRELLLSSKEIAEERGFRVLHGMTDAIWVQKENASQKDYADLRDIINSRINEIYPGIFPDNPGFRINIEGIYKWIVFVRGKIDKIGVPNKYFGVFKDNSVKIRGIQVRRGDTPLFIKKYQNEILDILKECHSSVDYINALSAVKEKTMDYIKRLEYNDFDAFELCVVKRISKTAEDYKVNSDISCAVGTLAHSGIKVNPGEKVGFLYVSDSNIKSVPYEIFVDNPQAIDIDRYKKMLIDSESVFILN